MRTIIIAAVALLAGLLFGWICCVVLSVNVSDEEWEMMMEELERQRYGEVHQEEPRR